MFEFKFEKTDAIVKTTRRVYNLFDFLNDMAGVSDLIFRFFGLFVLPYNRITQTIESTKTLYKVKSKYD